MKCLVVITTVGLSLVASSCAANNSIPTAASHARATRPQPVSTFADTPAEDYSKADRDRDNDFAPADDTNNDEILDFGRPANETDRRAVTALIKRYYAAAVAGDGARACSMLYVTFAESVAEDYGSESAGAPYLREGKTCPAVMTLLFKHFHSQLEAESPFLKVNRVRLEQHHGLAVLSFGKMPERQIPVHRERLTWKIVAVLDGALP